MRLVYFSWIREKVGFGEEDVTLPADVLTIQDVMNWLKTRDETYEMAFEYAQSVRAAINQEIVEHDALIKDAKEIAFFPPMTGG